MRLSSGCCSGALFVYRVLCLFTIAPFMKISPLIYEKVTIAVIMIRIEASTVNEAVAYLHTLKTGNSRIDSPGSEVVSSCMEP